MQEPFCLMKGVPTSVATPCRETWQGHVSWLATALSLMLFQAPLLVQLHLCLRFIQEHGVILHTHLCTCQPTGIQQDRWSAMLPGNELLLFERAVAQCPSSLSGFTFDAHLRILTSTAPCPLFFCPALSQEQQALQHLHVIM